jgi:hypothetical protein
MGGMGFMGVVCLAIYQHITTHSLILFFYFYFYFFLLFPSGIRSHGIIKITKSITVDYITETRIKVRTSA